MGPSWCLTTVGMRPHRARSAKLFCSIEGTPFVSVSVTLAAIFLLIAMVVIEPPSGGGIDLAKVNYPISMPDAKREDALIVAVMRNGWIFFGNDRVTPEELGPKVYERQIHAARKTIYLKIDGGARYADVAGVLDSLRSVGVGKVSLLLDQRKIPTLSHFTN